MLSVTESPKEKHEISDALAITEKLGNQIDKFEKLKETIVSTKQSVNGLLPNLKDERKQLKEKTANQAPKTPTDGGIGYKEQATACLVQ